MRLLLLLIAVVATGLAQQPTQPSLDKRARAAVIEALAAKLKAGYVLPDSSQSIIQALQKAQQAGDYDAVQTPKEYAEMLTATLRSASHDKHLSVFYDPQPAPSSQVSPNPSDARERYNFGFGKLERLRGNVGYLEILSFAPVEQAAETGGTYLSALANFDAIILDLRKNGGGNTPMVAFVASYFFDASPVHLTDIYWRDSNETSQFWTWPLVPGRQSAGERPSRQQKGTQRILAAAEEGRDLPEANPREANRKLSCSMRYRWRLQYKKFQYGNKALEAGNVLIELQDFSRKGMRGGQLLSTLDAPLPL